MYDLWFSEGVEQDLRAIRPYDRSGIPDAMEEALTHAPDTETRNRKRLSDLLPPFEFVPPVWELRVGEFRVFYDVDREAKRVYVRAVRHKPPHLTTEEIL